MSWLRRASSRGRLGRGRGWRPAADGRRHDGGTVYRRPAGHLPGSPPASPLMQPPGWPHPEHWRGSRHRNIPLLAIRGPQPLPSPSLPPQGAALVRRPGRWTSPLLPRTKAGCGCLVEESGVGWSHSESAGFEGRARARARRHMHKQWCSRGGRAHSEQRRPWCS